LYDSEAINEDRVIDLWGAEASLAAITLAATTRGPDPTASPIRGGGQRTGSQGRDCCEKNIAKLWGKKNYKYFKIYLLKLKSQNETTFAYFLPSFK
jgi:hypothetical protein